MESKLISIGMPVYNGEACIAGALDCLLGQTHRQIELIVSDDASTDRTGEVCLQYAGRDSRIRYIREKNNLGLVKNFSAVLAEARGEYFMWAAQDDWWDPRFIEYLARALDLHPECGVAMSHFQIFRAGRGQREDAPGGRHAFTGRTHAFVYRSMLIGRANPIFEYGLWRREALRTLFARGKPACVEDTKAFLCEAALATHFYSVPEALHAKYRNPAPLLERHLYLGAYGRRRFVFTRNIGIMLLWLMTSPVIPLRRKPLIFIPWMRYLWRKKRKVLAEFLSGGKPLRQLQTPITIESRESLSAEFFTRVPNARRSNPMFRAFFSLMYDAGMEAGPGTRLLNIYASHDLSVNREEVYRERFFNRCEYEAVDFWEDAFVRDGGGGAYGAPHTLPFPDAHFDVLVTTKIIMEHISEPEKVVREFARVLKPGGRAFVVAPLVRRQHQKPHDYFRYTEFGLRHLFSKAGFRETEITHSNGAMVTLSTYAYFFQRSIVPRPLQGIFNWLHYWVIEPAAFFLDRFDNGYGRDLTLYFMVRALK